MPYTWGAAVAVVVALAVDFFVTRERLVSRGRFWLAYLIIVGFQLVMNGLLTGIPIVTYDPEVHLGIRLANAPIEDIGFGFGLVLTVLTVWSRLGTCADGEGARSERQRDL